MVSFTTRLSSGSDPAASNVVSTPRMVLTSASSSRIRVCSNTTSSPTTAAATATPIGTEQAKMTNTADRPQRRCANPTSVPIDASSTTAATANGPPAISATTPAAVVAAMTVRTRPVMARNATGSATSTCAIPTGINPATTDNTAVSAPNTAAAASSGGRSGPLVLVLVAAFTGPVCQRPRLLFERALQGVEFGVE